jgi:predicted permease
MLEELRTRLRFFLARRRTNELDEEIQFHLDQAIAAEIATGKTPEEARRRAMIAFGGIERTREQSHEQRPSWWMDTVAQDVRYALRGFRRNPTFTVTVIATLALGIGATTAVFSVVDRILFRSLPYAHSDRLVSVGLVAPIIPQEFMLGGSYYEWRDHQTPFEALTSETGVNECYLTERNARQLRCASVEQNFLSTLGISPILGRNFLPEEDRPNEPKAALISYELWRAHYGLDPSVVNRLVDMDGKQVRVIGVLPKDFEMPTLQDADILVPQALEEVVQRKAMPGAVLYAFARLKPGITVEQAKAALQPVFNFSLNLAPPAFRKEVHLQVRPIRDRLLHDVRLVAWVLFGAAVAVLLIGCTNVLSLLMARAAAHERELAVRSALGASQGRLVRQKLTEALLLSLAGAVAGCVLAEALVRVFIALAPSSIPFLRNAHLDLRIILFALLLSLLSGIVFGILPALHKPGMIALSNRTTGSGRHALVRRVLVAGQIAISMILLTGAALLLRSFRNLQTQDIGVQTVGVLSARITLPRYRYTTSQQRMEIFSQAEAALHRLPGVVSLGVSDSLPPGGTHGSQIYSNIAVAGRPHAIGGTGGMVAWRWVTPEYFNTLGIPLVRGRAFKNEDRTSGERYIILSSLLASRLFGREDPVGQRLQPVPGGPWFVVSGVVANVKNAGLSGSDEPEYYLLRRNVADDWNSGSDASAVIVIKTSLSQEALAPWVTSQIAQLDPTVPVEVQTLSENVSKLADRPRFASALLGFFASCGLLMAVVGLYGVVSFVATRRTQEIGVRMALGARRFDILRLVTWEGVRLILIGGAVGLIAALGVTRIFSSMLFHVAPRDPISFVAVAVLFGLVALVAILIPARGAMKTDPMVALRYE